MTFVTAWLAAAGLAATAIPILIHLLMRRRRQPVPWAAMRLLREALRERARRLRLEQLLLLGLRCLLFVLLGAAVAQPLLSSAAVGERTGGRVVFLVVDDSMVAGAADQEGRTALAAHVAQAEQVLEALQPGDAVGVVATGSPARGLLLPPTTDVAAARALLRSLTPSSASGDLAGAMALLGEEIERLDEERPVVAYLFSDFRRGAANLEARLPPALSSLPQRNVRLLACSPATEMIDDVHVAALAPLRSLLLPGQSDGSGQITVQLGRYGSMPAESSTVTLSGPAIRPVEPRTVRWAPGQAQASVEFVVEPVAPDAAALGLAAQLEPDALDADNRRHAVLESRRAVRVVLLDRRSFGAQPGLERLSGGQWIARALRPSEVSPIELSVEDPTRLTARDLRGADAVVAARPDLLNEEGWAAVRELAARGGLVLVVPPEELNVHLWTDQMVETLNLPWSVGLEPVADEGGLALAERQPPSALLRLLSGELSDLARPVHVWRRLPIDASTTTARPVLVAADGALLAIAGTPRSAEGDALPGQVVLLAMAPELSWTDLPTRPLMVPLVQEIVRQGVGLGAEAQQTLVGDRPLAPPSATELVRVGEPPARLAVRSGRAAPAMRDGLYEILDGAAQPLGLVAVNIDPAAADTHPQPAEAVASWLGDSGPWTFLEGADAAAPLRTVERGASFAWILLLAALACAALEALLARRFSHADAPRRGVLLGTGAAP